MSALLFLLLGNVALAAGALLAGDALGARWHHDVAYVALVAVALLLVPLWRRRRFTTLVLASLGAWATLTGIALVHVTPATGGARAVAFWHGATSVGFSLAFLAHWARNSPRLWQLARRAAASRAALAVVAGAWLALLALALLSLRPPVRDAFDDTTFPHLTNASLALAAVALVYGTILLAPRVRDLEVRHRARGALDVSLLAAAWLALLSGLPLLYFARALREADAYWLVSGWHAILSVALLGLALGHAAFNARPLARHASGRRHA